MNPFIELPSITASLLRRLPLTCSRRPTQKLSKRSFGTATGANNSSTKTFSASSDEPVIKTSYVPAPDSGNIKILLLNRPQSRNALSRQLVGELNRLVKVIRLEEGRGPTRALVIGSNTDGAFCAGADLKERAMFTREETEMFLSNLRGTFKDIEALPIPTISAISSTALGGGLELALSTNLRVFGSTAMVGLPETRLAIIPGAGGTYRLPRLIGVNRAIDLILTGRRVSGAEGYFMGLCNRLVQITQDEVNAPDVAREKVLYYATQLALDICEGGPIALVQALKAVNGFKDGEKIENDCYNEVLKTEDRLEAIKAFVEKRKPSFKAR